MSQDLNKTFDSLSLCPEDNQPDALKEDNLSEEIKNLSHPSQQEEESKVSQRRVKVIKHLLKSQPLEVFEGQKSNLTFPVQVCNTQEVDLVSILPSSNLLTESTKEQSLNDLVQALKRRNVLKIFQV